MQPGRYEEGAYGKVNLGLAVLTRRGDGFHEVETLMVRIGLRDDVIVTVGRSGGEPAGGAPQLAAAEVRLVGRSDGAVGGDELEWGEDNLAHRAALAYLNAYLSAPRTASAAAQAAPPAKAAPPSVHIEVVKRLPVAAGLGGGSADAAAVLTALSRSDAASQATGQPLVSFGELHALALGLGSDVPFFLQASAAVARGRGERLMPVQVPLLHLVLVNPGTKVSAADAYRQLVGFTPRLREVRALERLRTGDDPGWSNGLQPGVLRMHPPLREVLSELRSAGLKGVLMSGSGATCFGLAGSRSEAEEVAERVARTHPGWWTAAVDTVT